jgi:hypothetical protein
MLRVVNLDEPARWTVTEQGPDTAVETAVVADSIEIRTTVGRHRLTVTPRR